MALMAAFNLFSHLGSLLEVEYGGGRSYVPTYYVYGF